MLYNSKAASSKFAQIIRVPEVYLCTTCNMGACDFHMYMPSIVGPAALGLQAYISGKFLVTTVTYLYSIISAFTI